MFYHMVMDTFAALADPTRRTILEMLAMKGQLSASAISNNFKMSPPAISQHLKILREAKLVDMEKNAQQRLYKINMQQMLTLEEWITKMTRVWEERFEALDMVLEEEKKKLVVRKEVNRYVKK